MTAGIIHLVLNAQNHPVYAAMSYMVPTGDKTKPKKSWALHMLIKMSLSSTKLTVFLQEVSMAERLAAPLR